MGFAQALDLLQQKDYANAILALDRLEKRSGKVPWVKSHKLEIDTARRQAKWELSEAAAEQLYAQAAALYRDEDLRSLAADPETPPGRLCRLPGVGRHKAEPVGGRNGGGRGQCRAVAHDCQERRADFRTIQDALDARNPTVRWRSRTSGPMKSGIWSRRAPRD